MTRTRFLITAVLGGLGALMGIKRVIAFPDRLERGGQRWKRDGVVHDVRDEFGRFVFYGNEAYPCAFLTERGQFFLYDYAENLWRELA